MAKVTCIDVSCWQENVDYAKVKSAGIEAVIIRAGFGRETSQKDSEFEKHYKNAKANGLKIGAYWYSYAVSVEDAKKEAKACLACIKGKTFDMPIYFDMEDSSQTKLGKSTLTAMAKAFCEAIKAGGYRAGIYANLNWFTNYLDYNSLKKSHSIWLAQYHTTNQLNCDIWQNSSSGKINGVSGNCDTNIIFDDSVFGKTITTNKTTTPKKKSNETIANEVIAGKWGNGDERKKKITSAGYNYNTIQALVNKKLGVSTFKSYNVKVTSSNGVNVRKGPGTNYSIVKAIPKNNKQTIVAESTGQGAKKWGKLKSGAGWIALDYTEKIK